MPDETLLSAIGRQAPPGDLFVFAYGSLMWNPGFPHKSAASGRVHGYCRRLAIVSTHYRGTPQNPGLVFGLDSGGSCNGIVYRVTQKDKAATLRYLFDREMFANVYTPSYINVSTATSRHRTLAFIVRRQSPQYVKPLPDEQTIRIIRSASGKGGTNSDYIRNAQQQLSAHDISCPTLTHLCRLL